MNLRKLKKRGQLDSEQTITPMEPGVAFQDNFIGRKANRPIMLYKGLKGAARIPTNDLVPPNKRTRNHLSLAFQTPLAGTNVCKSIFFPQTIKDWNSLTDFCVRGRFIY